MALGKQAKTLSKAQVEGALGYIGKTRYPHRNRVILLAVIEGGIQGEGDSVPDLGYGDGRER
jgi:integrase/recombinase XerD